MAKTQFYVKFKTLITGGTAPAYFASDYSSTFPAATTYYVLKVNSLNLTGQTVSPLDGTNTFSTLAFEVVDPKKTGAADTGTITDLIFQNKTYLFKTIVEFYETTADAAFPSTTLRFTGYLSKYDRIAGGWSFECESKFARLSNPITFPTGSFQVQAAFDVLSANGIVSVATLKNGVNLTPPTRTNFLSGATVWTQIVGGQYSIMGTAITGTLTTGSPGITLSGGYTTIRSSYTDITVGSGATSAKLGCCYTYYVTLPQRSLGSVADGTLVKLTAEGYAGTQKIDSFSSDQCQVSATLHVQGTSYVGVTYILTDPSVTAIRLTVAVDDSDVNATLPASVTNYFGLSNTWLIGREIVDVLTYANTTGTAAILRGACGSLPSYHAGDEQAINVTILAGHPFDVARRLFLTTKVAGTNGNWDVGDGYGLGTEVTSAMIGPSWATEQTYQATGTLYTAWVAATAYNVGDLVSSGGSNWSSLTVHTDSVVPAEGALWTQIRNRLDGYDFKNAEMLFLVPAKIENIYDWICQNIMKPIHANMFEDANGLLGVHYWRAIETAGSGTLGEGSRVYSGEIPMTTDRENVINKVIYRMDYDPLGAVDVQGNQSGGSNNLLREFVFTEPTFGEDSATASSAALYQNRELTIESSGGRGSYSSRFGYCYNIGVAPLSSPAWLNTATYVTNNIVSYGGQHWRAIRNVAAAVTPVEGADWTINLKKYKPNGDQVAYEVARRIVTRYRFPVDEYDFDATLSKRTLSVGDVPSVTHPNMLNMTTGAWGRTNSPMSIISSETDYASATVKMRLRADGDAIAIPNTTVTASTAPSAPLVGTAAGNLFYGGAAWAAGTYAVDSIVTNAGANYRCFLNTAPTPAAAPSSVDGVKYWAKDGAASLPAAINGATALSLMKFKNFPLFPKDYCNIVYLCVATNMTAGMDLLIYAYASTYNATPDDSQLNLVGEILTTTAVGATNDFYFLVDGNSASSTYYWVKMKYRNADRITSNFSAFAVSSGGAGGVGLAGLNRGPKLEIRQISGDALLNNPGGIVDFYKSS